ncbi:MAG: hypothetical protein WD449_01900 [Candidatus Babeliales bacterium]
MIEFNRYGNPQPDGLVKFEYKDLKLTFVDGMSESETRKDIFENYERYLHDFKKVVSKEFKQWVNGSFTTIKVNPNDIDLVNIIEYSEELNNRQNVILKFHSHGGSKEKYLVDGYLVQVYSDDDPRYLHTQRMLDYWLNWFGKDRDQRPKALLEVEII